MNFVNGLEKATNMTTTENGAVALKSTGSNLLNLFGIIGALRTRPAREIEQEFLRAFSEDKLLATKMLFYARNVRGGLGERNTFRVALAELARVSPEIVIKNLHLIPLFGRWDDLFCLLDNKAVKPALIELIKAQIIKDSLSDNPSLLGKWMPSENTSSLKTRRLATELRLALNSTPKSYRLMLTSLRAKIRVTETLMSAKKWEDIQYEKVCSGTMTKCRNAFARNDADRWVNYLESLVKGETKVNASTLFPYDLFRALGFEGAGRVRKDALIEEQWKALPNYVKDGDNVLIMADTSGSMNGLPFMISTSLAVYFAERAKGPFHNKFLTFAEKPSFHTLTGDSLYEKLQTIKCLNVGNTDVEAAFELILKVAIENNLSDVDLPKALVIISDMEFDQAKGHQARNYDTLYDTIRKKFNDAGYELPNVVFWNAESRSSKYQVNSMYPGVQLASGASPSVFSSLVNNLGKNPYDAMLDVLSNPVYDCITI